MRHIYSILFALLFFATTASAQWYFETSINDSKFTEYTSNRLNPSSTDLELDSYSGFRDFSHSLGYLFSFNDLEERLADDYRTPFFRLGTGLVFDQMSIKTNANINELKYPVNYNLSHVQGRLGVYLTPVIFKRSVADYNGIRQPSMELSINGGIGYNFYNYGTQHFDDNLFDLIKTEEFDKSYLAYFFGAGLHFPLSKSTRLYGQYSVENAFALKEATEVNETYSVLKRKISLGLIVDFGLASALRSKRDARIRDLENKPAPEAYDDTELVERISEVERALKEHNHPTSKIDESVYTVETHNKGFMYFPDFKHVLFPLSSSYFNKNKYEERLKDLARFLNQNPQLSVKLVGYADSRTGGRAHNLKLSEKRAKRVRDYLVSKCGVSPYRLETLGAGETLHFSTNDLEKNRRTEIIIIE